MRMLVLILLFRCAMVWAQQPYSFEDAAFLGNLARSNASPNGGGDDITDGLVSRWKFDESTISGSSATDSVGGLTATLSGSPSTGTGHINEGLVLNGTSQYVYGPYSLAYDLSTNWSVSIWANFSAVPAQDKYPNLIGRFGGVLGYGIMWNGSLKAATGDGYDFYYTAGYTPSTNEWHHYAATYGGGALYLYVDGVPFATNTVNAAQGPGTVTVNMGAHYDDPGTYGYMAATLDDARIYNTTLSATNIYTLYAFTGP